MSGLHACAATPSEIATQFGIDPAPDFDIPLETVEGQTGVAIFENGGRRHLSG